MTSEELSKIRSWDKRCGDNETTFFPITLDRRRLLEYVDELQAQLAALIDRRPIRADGRSLKLKVLNGPRAIPGSAAAPKKSKRLRR